LKSKSAISVLALLLIVLVGLGPARASDSYRLDPSLPLSASLRSCENNSALDCIESVSAVIDGKKISAKEIGFAPKKPHPQIAGNQDNVGDVLFSYKVGSDSRVMKVDSTLETPAHKYDSIGHAGRLWTELDAGNDNDKKWTIVLR
jgi:hypothetical protein